MRRQPLRKIGAALSRAVQKVESMFKSLRVYIRNILLPSASNAKQSGIAEAKPMPKNKRRTDEGGGTDSMPPRSAQAVRGASTNTKEKKTKCINYAIPPEMTEEEYLKSISHSLNFNRQRRLAIEEEKRIRKRKEERAANAQERDALRRGAIRKQQTRQRIRVDRNELDTPAKDTEHGAQNPSL